MSNKIDNQFLLFNDLQGNPLENGNIYIGEEGKNPKTNPITVFWDKDLTVPASQPLKTISGYISRNGTPANVYVQDNFSITADDKNNNNIFTELFGTVSLSGDQIPLVVKTVDDIANVNSNIYTTIIVEDEARGGIFVKTLPSQSNDNGVWFSGYKRQNTEKVNPKWFDAKGDWNGSSGTVDTTAMQNTLDYMFTNNNPNMFCDGNFLIGQVSPNINLKQLCIEMTENSSWVCQDSIGLVYTPFGDDWEIFNLANDALLGSTEITMTAHDFEVGDIIYIDSQATGETGFGYKAAGAYIVDEINGNIIYVDKPLRFDFLVADSARASKNTYDSLLKLINCTFEKKSTDGSCVSAKYVNNIITENLKIKNIDASTVDGLVTDISSNIFASNTIGEDVRYTILCSTGINARINKIHGKNVRHHVDFANFFEDGVVDGFSGQTREGGVNTHPAFNITYLNGSTNDTTQVSNFRAIGGGIQDVKMTFGGQAGGAGMLFGIAMSNTAFYDNLQELGLDHNFENISVIDRRSSGTGFDLKYGGNISKFNYETRGGAITYGLRVGASGYANKTTLSDIRSDAPIDTQALYSGNNSNWDASEVLMENIVDNYKAVDVSGVKEVRFRDRLSFRFDGLSWRIKGNLVTQTTATLVQALFELSPVTFTFPDRTGLITITTRVDNEIHVLKKSFFQIGTSIFFAGTDLENNSTNPAACLSALTVNTVEADRDTLFDINITKGVGKKASIDYELEFRYL